MKKCPKCKTLWTDEIKFCGKCGTKLEHAEIVTEEKKVPVKEKTETKQIVLPEKIITTRQKSSSRIKRIIAVVLIFAVLITGGQVVIHKVSNSINNPYVYLSNGKFYFVRNAEKNEPIEIPVGETEDYIKLSISLSPDEKYLYVLRNYDYENGTGDLYQCQYKKLKKNSSKNEKYCKLIATDIYPSYTPMNEGKVVYKSEDSTLYFYNGKEPKKLQKNVSQFFYTENEEKYSVDDMITDSRGETETLQNIREELEYISEDGLKPIKVSKDGETYDVDDKAYSDWTHYYGNTLLYASLSDFKPIDLAEIQEDEDFIENVEEKIELEFLDAGLHLVSGDNEVVVTGDAARDLLTMIDNDENGMSIYINETDVIASSDEQVVAAKIDKGKVSQFELVSDMGYPITANKSAIYYATNQQKDGDIIYYDVYAYHNGKSKCIVPHASMNLVDIYEDGEILANTDCNDGLNLSLINSKGKEYLIGEDVSSYIKYEKNQIIYLSGHNLWMYKNGKTDYLASGVTWIWSLDTIEKPVQLGYADE